MDKSYVEKEVQEAIAEAVADGSDIVQIVLSYDAWHALFGDETRGPELLTGAEIRERLNKKLYGYNVGFSSDDDAPTVQLDIGKK